MSIASIVKSIESNYNTIQKTTFLMSEISLATWVVAKFALPLLGFDNVGGVSLTTISYSALGIGLATAAFGIFATGIVNRLNERRLGSS